MRFGSICSGIEAASVAWGPLGWSAAWLAEIDPFASAVLRHHYPAVPNYGDMQALPALIRAGLIESPEVFCGGTPCQAFSVAGLRKSLDDARGNLTLTYCEIANAIDDRRAQLGQEPAVDFWENVPGVLNTPDNAFGCFLAGLAGEDDPLQPPGGGKWGNAGLVLGPRRTVAWRTLDAQFFGLAQRRRRVFVIASAREDFDPAAVLFEFDSVRRDSAPSRQTSEDIAGTVAGGARQRGGFSHDDIPATVATLDASYGRLQGASGQDANHGHSHLIAGTLTGNPKGDGLGHRGKLLAFGGNNCGGPIEAAAALRAKGGSGHNDFESETFVTHALRGEGFDASEDGTGRGTPPMACLPFDTTQITSRANRSNPQAGDPCHPLAAGAHPPAIAFNARQECVSSTDLFGSLGSSSPQAEAVAYTTKLHNTGSNNAGKVFEEYSTCLDANSPPPALLTATQVRRLMPLECERLQGFADNYTRIPMRAYAKRKITKLRPADLWEPLPDGRWILMAADGPRYKALGNSWPVPVVAWLGRRIQRELEQ